jgi:hypothetical protein
MLACLTNKTLKYSVQAILLNMEGDYGLLLKII